MKTLNADNVTSHEDKGNEARMWRTFYILFVSLVIDLLAFTVILPLLPSLLDHYGQSDQGGLYAAMKNCVSGFRQFVGAPDTPKWNSVLFGGVIGSLFSFLQFLCTPIIGAASDVYGRRPLMLLCSVGISLSYILWMVSSNFTLFVVARIVGGLSKGNVSLCASIVTDVSSLHRRANGMALIGVAFSIGFIFGPLIGAVFCFFCKDSESFFVLPAAFCIILAVGDVIFLYIFLPETLPPHLRSSRSVGVLSNAFQLINPVRLFKFSSVTTVSEKEKTVIQTLGCVYFIFLYIFSGMEFVLPFLMQHRFQYTSVHQGKMFLFIGSIMALAQGGYVRRIKPGKELTSAVQGITLLVPAFAITAFATNIILMYSGLALFSFASAVVVPCLMTIVSGHGGVDQKGLIMGIVRSLGSLARASSAVCACLVYWCFGSEVCFLSAALMMLLPAMLLRKLQPIANKKA